MRRRQYQVSTFGGTWNKQNYLCFSQFLMFLSHLSTSQKNSLVNSLVGAFSLRNSLVIPGNRAVSATLSNTPDLHTPDLHTHTHTHTHQTYTHTHTPDLPTHAHTRPAHTHTHQTYTHSPDQTNTHTPYCTHTPDYTHTPDLHTVLTHQTYTHTHTSYLHTLTQCQIFTGDSRDDRGKNLISRIFDSPLRRELAPIFGNQ